MVQTNVVYIDASYYLSLLMPDDANHEKAKNKNKKFVNSSFITTQAILGEVLTVGSQKFDKQITITFVERIINSKTLIVLEQANTVELAWKYFKQINSKNVSWIDCFSFAVMEEYEVETFLSFDKHFSKYALKYR